MPIPTDTFWNIRRLNVVFALSAVLLFAITAASILQDYGKDWHTPQREGRVWDAALTEEKIQSDLTPDKQKLRDQLDAQIADKQKQIEASDKDYDRLTAEMKKLESDRATSEFHYNTQKSLVGVLESNLQDAKAAGDTQLSSEIEAKLKEPRATLAKMSEELEAIKVDQKQRKEARDKKTAEIDALKKEKTKLVGDAELLEKKLDSLQPQSISARISEIIRAAPLMGFINPADKVNQIVLPDVMTDVAFMKIPTVDRCTTCHVNIAKKEFAEDKILAYLEEQTATARKLKLPTSQPTRASDPVAYEAKPGAVALPEFWHNWARQLEPESVKKLAPRLSSMTNTVGKIATVKIDGKPLSSFKYDPTLNDPRAQKSAATQPAATTQPVLADPDLQSQVLVALMKAWYLYDPSGKSPSSATEGKVTVDLAPTDAKNITAPRNAALRYPEELKTALLTTLDKNQLHLLLSRYRYALIDVVNPARKAQRLEPLDPSAVHLAHPRLDLYVDVDSKHSFEAVGCTSCHDGSGQETDFVVAAHTPRDIYVDSNTGEPVLNTQLVHQPAPPNTIPAMASMLAAIYPPEMVVPAKVASLHIEVPSESTPEKPDSASIDYVDPVNNAKHTAITQFEYWKKTYEPKAPRGFELVYHEWDWPMRSPEMIQANCVRCHVDAYDIKQEAPVVYEGRYLFTNLGCVNCHQMDSIPTYENRKVGTDLRHVTAKLSPAFINSWIWAPKSFRPSTKMPHFFMLENNSSDEELRRTRQEARAITEYLVRTAAPLPAKYKPDPTAKGSAEAGRALFDSLGCLACHQNLNDPTDSKRNGKPVKRGEQWIVNDLVKSGKLKAKLIEESGKEPDEKTVTTEAQTLYDGMTYNERQLYVLENLEQLPGAMEQVKYPDNSPKPIFMHHGPELSGIGTKLLSGRTRDQAVEWLFNWLKEPRHYSEYTVMPQLRLSDQQAMDLIEYLLSQTREANKPGDTWKAELTPIDSPKLIELTSLFLRARYSVQRSIEKADDDKELTDLATDALTTPIQPKADASAIVAKMDKDEKRLVFLGKKLIAHYGCMSCHAINGAENITSPCANLSDWGQKQVSKLDYGYLDPHHVEEFHDEGAPNPTLMMVNGLCESAQNIAHMKTDWSEPIASPVKPQWPDVEHTRDSWLEQKLRNTRVYDRGKALLEPQREIGSDGKPVIKDGAPVVADPGKPYDKLRMPTFYLSDEQIHAIVVFVISNRDRLISEKLTNRATTDEAKRIAHGRELTLKYNCVSCHVIEENVPQIQQYYDPTLLTDVAPPSLRGEGNKVQFDWLFNFFKNVEPLRPLLMKTIRMPSFPATDQEWSDILAYFNTISVKESHDLHKTLDPVFKYIEDEKKTAKNPSTKPSDIWPGDDWYTRNEFASAAEYLRKWSLAHKQMTELQYDPAKNTGVGELGRNYRTALFKARFTMELYDAPYPFVEKAHANIDDARMKQGEEFFHQMQCLSCHQLGDPSAAGAVKDPKGPNLSLAAYRLQRRWVRHWVQEPPVIQVSTKMPQFFSGLPIFKPDGQPWAAAQSLPDDAVKFYNARYGQTVEEETGLLLDYLYAAGAKNVTSVQPPKASLPAPPKPEVKAAPAKASPSKATTKASSATTKPSTRKSQ